MAILHLVFIISCVTICHSSQDEELDGTVSVYWLQDNQQYQKVNYSDFNVFCQRSRDKSLFQAWRSVHFVLENPPPSYQLILGINATDVWRNYNGKSIWHPSSWISGASPQVDFPAFSQHCVGVAARETYSVLLKVRAINYWRVLLSVFGVLLFLSAPSLSRNSFFHYTSGISVGVLASLLILIYVISRFIPKKSASYAVLAFGWSFVFYVVKLWWGDVHRLLASYTEYLVAYGLVATALSFVICYRMGPVRNARTMNLIQWGMQVIAVSLVYYSSEIREVSSAVVIVLAAGRIVPPAWITKCKRTWRRYFPPRVKLLTEIEYIEQGQAETKRALEQLRQYCGSPDCNAWATVCRLRDPLRFAEFMDSGSHCSDRELLLYNSESTDEEEGGDASDGRSSRSNGSAKGTPR